MLLLPKVLQKTVGEYEILISAIALKIVIRYLYHSKVYGITVNCSAVTLKHG